MGSDFLPLSDSGYAEPGMKSALAPADRISDRRNDEMPNQDFHQGRIACRSTSTLS
jgi:hypothetical protein